MSGSSCGSRPWTSPVTWSGRARGNVRGIVRKPPVVHIAAADQINSVAAPTLDPAHCDHQTVETRTFDAVKVPPEAGFQRSDSLDPHAAHRIVHFTAVIDIQAIARSGAAYKVQNDQVVAAGEMPGIGAPEEFRRLIRIRCLDHEVPHPAHRQAAAILPGRDFERGAVLKRGQRLPQVFVSAHLDHPATLRGRSHHHPRKRDPNQDACLFQVDRIRGNARPLKVTPLPVRCRMPCPLSPCREKDGG